MIRSWLADDVAALPGWRIRRMPGERLRLRVRRVVTDFARDIARLEQREAKEKRRRK